MKKIIKSREPNSLIQHRANTHSSYDNLPTQTKNDIRQSLLEEQGYICCYCMRRLPESNHNPGSKIEHLKCISENETLQLSYSNILLSCLGGEGKPNKLHTCDTAKGDKSLSFDPIRSIPNIEDFIKYKANGEIYSTNSQINSDIEDILNLNVKSLVDNRRVKYEELQRKFEAEGKNRRGKTIKKNYFIQEKTKLLAKTNNKFDEFCMIGIYYLNKKLKKFN